MRHGPLISTILACAASVFPSALSAEITFSGPALYNWSFDLPEGDQIFQDWHAKGIDPDDNRPSAASCWVYTPDYLIVEINDRNAAPYVSRQPAKFEPVITVLSAEFGIDISFDPSYVPRALPLRVEINGQDVSTSILPDSSVPPSQRTDQFLDVLARLESGKQFFIYETFEVTSPPRLSFGLRPTGQDLTATPSNEQGSSFAAPSEDHDLTQLDWFDRSAPRPRFDRMPEEGNTSLSVFTFPVSLDGFSEAYQQALEWCGWDGA